MPASDETPLGGGGVSDTAVSHDRLSTAAVESVLNLDDLLNQARRVEKVAHICTRGDLQAEHDDLFEELAGLVDADGRVLHDDEGSLQGQADQRRAVEIDARLQEIRGEMKAATYTVRFRALSEDEWSSWDKTQRGTDGKYKDPDAANVELIAKTAIAPTLDVDQVQQLRRALGPTQIAELANKAFEACTTGGVDVPKSPLFSPSQRRDSSGRN